MNLLCIFGVPRSGTTWLSQILNSHPDVVLRFQPLFSYSHKGALNEKSSKEEIYQFFEEIYHSKDPFVNMTTNSQSKYPVFIKSEHPAHLLFKETRYLNVIENILNKCTDIRVICIVRNPLATLASWKNAPKEFDPSWNFIEEWRYARKKNQNRPEEFYGYERWKYAAQLFMRLENQFRTQLRLIKYKELKTNTLDTVLGVFKFCNLEMRTQVENFIKVSTSRHDSDPYSVFRAEASDEAWRNELPDEVIKYIYDDLKESNLNIFL